MNPSASPSSQSSILKISFRNPLYKPSITLKSTRVSESRKRPIHEIDFIPESDDIQLIASPVLQLSTEHSVSRAKVEKKKNIASPIMLSSDSDDISPFNLSRTIKAKPCHAFVSPMPIKSTDVIDMTIDSSIECIDMLPHAPRKLARKFEAKCSSKKQVIDISDGIDSDPGVQCITEVSRVSRPFGIKQGSMPASVNQSVSTTNFDAQFSSPLPSLTRSSSRKDESFFSRAKATSSSSGSFERPQEASAQSLSRKRPLPNRTSVSISPRTQACIESISDHELPYDEHTLRQQQSLNDEQYALSLSRAAEFRREQQILRNHMQNAPNLVQNALERRNNFAPNQTFASHHYHNAANNRQSGTSSSYQGMAHDPRNYMSHLTSDYEGLLQLGEQLGDVKSKSVPEHIAKSIQSYRYKQRDGSSDTKCFICLEDYTNGVKMKMLSCTHSYHTACLDEWMKNGSTCPVCRCVIE